VDKDAYPRIARMFLENTAGLDILQAQVSQVLVKNKKVSGIETNFGQVFRAKTVVVCAGTFLDSTIHIGLDSFPGGRLGEISCPAIFKSIKKLGHRTRFFKTGTCARLDKASIDFSRLEEQKPDQDASPFSFFSSSLPQDPLSCYITHTNAKTHRIIKKNLKYSPLYTGKIKARGVRYCPSLEDKVVKFSDHDRHQVFVEPEGRGSSEVYPNGVSTSLPYAVQVEFIRSIAGLENAVILRPGYGIEHGLIDPCQLYPTLESKLIRGLYFAGQVNGTTGYEEAAAQGLVAGINAGLAVKGKKPFILKRSQGFIGVMIDDLTSKGTDEPYRMFTSRSEFRLNLRESNADLRLLPLAVSLGMLEGSARNLARDKQARIDARVGELKKTAVNISGKKISLYDWLKRPDSSYQEAEKSLSGKIAEPFIRDEIEIAAKYEGFIRRQESMLKELENLERIKIPEIDFSRVPSLSREVVEKLNRFKPDNLAEALAISGVTPAAIASVYGYVKKRKTSI
jgi:tRNA uridine 5-carboxymethylaminomethyl modification enzyme